MHGDAPRDICPPPTPPPPPPPPPAACAPTSTTPPAHTPQDTSRVQYEWLRRITGQPLPGRPQQQPFGRSGGAEQAVFVAADDDQSVYGWRGADRTNVSPPRPTSRLSSADLG